jgi:peptidoglycan hydrolase-like protein with peptidoglycan-binding domain
MLCDAEPVLDSTELRPIERTRVRRGSLIVAAMLCVALVAGTVGWALATVFSPPDEVLDVQPFTTVRVASGEVGSSINLNTVAEWTPVPTGVNQSIGTVTSVEVKAGDEVDVGAALYTVDLRPVLAGKGKVPAFRALSSGATGADVSQLQTMLQSLGFYDGPVDGTFGLGVYWAVQNWQKSLGLIQTGIVELGDVLFLPDLPTRVAPDTETLSTGAQLAGGEQVLSTVPSSPTFRIPVTETQASLLPTAARVLITSPKGADWIGFAGEQTTDESGAINVELKGQDGSAICAKACVELPVTGPSLLRSQIITVETVQGLTVPTAALRSRANGSPAVIDEAGVEHPVEILASARGMSVIEGVKAGLQVRVPANEG